MDRYIRLFWRLWPRLFLVLCLFFPGTAPVRADDATDKERGLQQSGLVNQAPESKGRIRVAVLPFETPKNQPDLEQYGWGIVDALNYALMRVPRFEVLDRARIDKVIKEINFGMTGLVDAGTAARIGQLKGVQKLISGSIVTAGPQVQIAAYFTDVQTGSITEPHKVRGQMADIFDLWEQLAALFIKDEHAVVTAEQQQSITRVVKSTSNLTAHSYFEKGRKAFLLFTPQGYEESIKQYQKAIETDPQYALAYAGLAATWSYWAYRNKQNKLEYQTYVNNAMQAARKALAINPSLGEAHLAMGLAAHVAEKFDVNVQEAEAALKILPNSADGYYLLGVGRRQVVGGEAGIAEKIKWFKKALELDPDHIQSHNDLGVTYSQQGDFAAASQEFLQVVRLNPENPVFRDNLGFTLFKLKRFQDALQEFEKALELDPSNEQYKKRVEVTRRALAAQGP